MLAEKYAFLIFLNKIRDRHRASLKKAVVFFQLHLITRIVKWLAHAFILLFQQLVIKLIILLGIIQNNKVIEIHANDDSFQVSGIWSYLQFDLHLLNAHLSQDYEPVKWIRLVDLHLRFRVLLDVEHIHFVDRKIEIQLLWDWLFFIRPFLFVLAVEIVRQTDGSFE